MYVFPIIPAENNEGRAQAVRQSSKVITALHGCVDQISPCHRSTDHEQQQKQHHQSLAFTSSWPPDAGLYRTQCCKYSNQIITNLQKTMQFVTASNSLPSVFSAPATDAGGKTFRLKTREL